MVVSKKKAKNDILYLQDNKKNTKTAEENIDVGGDLKKTRFCKFYKQGRCKFGENCRNLHEKETTPRFNKKKSSGDKRGKYNNPYTVQSTKDEPSLTENTVRIILSEKESPQIQDLFTVTKDLQKDCKSFSDQMSKQLISITNILKGNQQLREPRYPQTMYPQILFSDNAQDASAMSSSSSEVPSKQVSSNPIISINKISCLYNNCDSLLNKIDELKIRLLDKNILISGITEIMPKNCLI